MGTPPQRHSSLRVGRREEEEPGELAYQQTKTLSSNPEAECF